VVANIAQVPAKTIFEEYDVRDVEVASSSTIGGGAKSH
jgi:hypothetical protein